MYFSLRAERKVPKERPLRKVPTVPSLGIHPPAVRTLFRCAECLCAVRPQFAKNPRCRRNDDHLSVPYPLCGTGRGLTEGLLLPCAIKTPSGIVRPKQSAGRYGV